jgi:hypothetical protein
VAIFVYLGFRLAETADIQDFEGDMRAMAELAETQPGYVWSEMGRSPTGDFWSRSRLRLGSRSFL